MNDIGTLRSIFFINMEHKEDYWKNDIVTKKRYAIDLIKKIGMLDRKSITTPRDSNVKISKEY